MDEESTVPTWTLSGFGDEIDPDPRVQAAVLSAIGAKHIEVRSAWGINVVDLTEEEASRLAVVLREQEMKVSAVASPIGKVDVSLDIELEISRLRRVIRVAHILGTENIRIFSFYRAEHRSAESVRDSVLSHLRAMAEEAEREKVVLLHENEKGIYGDIPERVLDIVESVGSPALRLAWDNANFVQVGVAPYTEAYALLRPYLDYLQVKDAVLSGAVVLPGRGDGQLLETLTALRDDGYSGFASLEPHLETGFEFGGYSGPALFGESARAFAALLDELGVKTR